MAPSLDATLTARDPVRPDLAFFTLALDAPVEGFEPGRYVTVGAPTPDGGWVRRPMTLTRPPARGGAEIELLLNRVTAPASPHPLSHALFDLPIGARLSVRPVATGAFTLALAPPERARLFVASETGLAPFLAMLRAEPALEATLVHAVDAESGLSARAELEAAPNLDYRPWISASDGPLARAFEELAVPLDPARTTALACGLGADLRATVEALLPYGFVPPQRRLQKALGLEGPPTLHLEQYDSTRLFDTKDEAEMARLAARCPR